MIEKRKYPRFQLMMDAKYRILKSEEVFKLGRTRNISAEGVCFESDEKLQIASHVDLEIDLKDKMPPVSLVGEIRWFQQLKTRVLKKKRYINGVRLVDIHKSDEGRFLRYYCDRVVEKLSAYLKL